MLATNHGLAGMAIGALLPLPVAIPVAFLSHFVLDALPHFGAKKRARNKPIFRKLVFVDTGIALAFAVVAAALGRWDMFWVGWVAYSPDLYWVFLYFKNGGLMQLKPKNRFGKFHQSIQREYAWGWVIELPLLFSLFLIVRYLYLTM